MSRLIPSAVLCLALGACAAAARLPTCDGRHRRPANLHGSLLFPAAGAASAGRLDPDSFRACWGPR